MQNRSLLKKNPRRLLFVHLSFLCCFSMIGDFNAFAATNYDLSDSSSSSNTTQATAPATAGTGTGQNGVPNIGNTNISFKDFGYVQDTNVRSNDATQAADLLSVNHSYKVTDSAGNQLQTNSYYSSAIKPNEFDASSSGTSFYQAPQIDPGQAGRQVNPYLPGSTSTLAPTSMALQATHNLNPTAFLPITGDKNSSFGGLAPSRIYNGPYGVSVTPTAASFNPASFAGANLLPAASYGLVDFNLTTK